MIVYVQKNKDEYYDILGSAKYVYSGAEEETFGYSILEGYLSGAVPVLSAIPCYKELYPKNCYTNDSELDEIISAGFRENYPIINTLGSCVENIYKFMGF